MLPVKINNPKILKFPKYNEMKWIKTQPTNRPFFQRYLKASRSYKGLGFLAQLVSGSTEFFGAYFLLSETAQSMGLPEDVTRYACIILASLITIGIEYSLYIFMPEAVKAILYREWRKPYLLMSLQNILIVLAVLPLGTYMSYTGAKKAVEKFASDKKTENEVNNGLAEISEKKDSTYNALINQYRTDFSNDSTEVVKASKNRTSGLSRSIRANRALESGGSSALRAQLKADIRTELADRSDKILALKLDMRERIKEARGETKIDEGEEDLKKKLIAAKENTSKNGKSLAILTIIFQVVFIFVTINNIQFSKGSGLKVVRMPSQYYFNQPLISHFITARGQRLRQKLENKIANFEKKTGVPPTLEGLHYMQNMPDDYSPPTQEVKHEKQKELEDIELTYSHNSEQKIEKEVYSLIEQSENIGGSEDKETIEAKILIGMYLQTNRPRKINKFLNACIDHTKGKGVNPFHPSRPIGFQGSAAMSNAMGVNSAYAMRNASKDGASGIPPFSENSAGTDENSRNALPNAHVCEADNCNNSFTKNTAWQRFCSNACKQYQNAVLNQPKQ
jgi:hypothetical protein